MENKPLRNGLFYKYKLVDEVEKNGKKFEKYKRIPRFGYLLFILAQSLKIILIGVLAIVISHVLINTMFNETKPAQQQIEK